MTDQLRRPPR